MSTKTWTVWVGGGEVTDYTVTLEEARQIAQHWTDKGYDEVCIDNITWEDINAGETAMNCKECGQELKEVGEMDEYQLCHSCYCTVMDTTTNKGEQQ